MKKKEGGERVERIEEFKGRCLGVRVEKIKKSEPLVTILIEDDEQWIEQDCHFSAYYLPELIEQLQKAKEQIELAGGCKGWKKKGEKK